VSDDARRRSLERAVRGAVRTDLTARRAAGRDGSHLVGRPSAVVVPVDAADVVRLVRWARRAKVPLVARGAGTSLDGESVPEDGAVVVDLAAWQAVHEVSESGRWARVDPGVVNARLHEELRPHGLFFPPNPGSWQTSTIGGNVATNASGPRSFAYGPTRRWVRELEVVLGTGERVRLGSRVEKRSLGPDLLQLVVGSEGTLGLVTEVTVRLAPTPALRRGLVVPLPPRARLGEIAVGLGRVPGNGLSAVEYLDAYSARGLATARSAPWEGTTPLLLLEVEAADEREAATRTARVRASLSSHGVPGPVQLFDDADRLWDLRGESGRVMDEELGSRIRDDVAVPPAQVDRLLRELERIARAEGVRVHVFAHLGEGSLHPNFVVDPESPAAARIRARTYAAALRLGGTISGEHGVGRLKRPFVARELGPAAVRLLEAIRAACDPDRILNPGKLYPPRGAARRSSPSPSRRGAARTPRG
jgi:FAD/FMN-containing dehydrogenase